MIFFICLEIMESSIEKSKSYTIVLQASKLQVTIRVGVLHTTYVQGGAMIRCFLKIKVKSIF